MPSPRREGANRNRHRPFYGLGEKTDMSPHTKLKGFRRVLALAALSIGAVLVLSVCGSGGSDGGSPSAIAPKSVASKPPATGCGSYTAPKLDDPSGLVAAL